MIFAKNEGKLGVYCMHTLLKASNLFRLSAYIPLIRKSCVAYCLNLGLDFGSFLGQFPKIMIFAKGEGKLGAYYIHTLFKVGNL